MNVTTLALGRVAAEATKAGRDRERSTLAPELAVSRTAVVNHLRSHQAPVVLLTAPAGYGKTTVLAQWAARETRRFAWVRLMPGIDAAELATLLSEAVTGQAAPKSGARGLARALGRWVIAEGEPVVIVVDGVETLGPDSLELIAAVADGMPAGTQVVLAGRQAPSLPVARLRAEGRLLELQAHDLRMTAREAQTLLQKMGVELGEDDLVDLVERSEGWPVGIFMCGLVLQPSRGRTGRSPVGFGGTHHFVSEYFDEEVLAQLPDDLMDFATQSAILDRMSGPLCDSVLGEDGSANRLHELAAAEAFVVPLDRERIWFRFHGFFRDALRKRLAQTAPQRFVELSQRAAEWYEQAEDAPAAIEHLRAIRDLDHAADLLGALTIDLCTRGAQPNRATLDDLRDRALAHHPAAAVAGALAHAMEGRVGEATRWATAAGRLPATGPMPDETASSEAWVALLRATLCHDGAERMSEDARLALAHLVPHSPLVPFALMLLGIGRLLAADRTAAESALIEASELAADAAPLVGAVAFAELSLMSQEEGNWERGEDYARTARDHAMALGSGDHAFGALAYAASARSALRNANWVRAGDDLDRIHDLLPEANEAVPWLAALARIEAGRAHLALNDIGTTAELVAEVEHLVLARPHLGTAKAALLDLQQQLHGLRKVPREASTLTAAELRLLPLLTTHLTFRQIAQHLYVSRNTIKTQAISVYRKLGVSSRTEAIDRAVELGLLRHDGDTAFDRS
jgi:LuxR family maltose regulon positive regulatory protein